MAENGDMVIPDIKFNKITITAGISFCRQMFLSYHLKTGGGICLM
jgi:hypothetical protein